jgi:hypothetical protein
VSTCAAALELLGPLLALTVPVPVLVFVVVDEDDFEASTLALAPVSADSVAAAPDRMAAKEVVGAALLVFQGFAAGDLAVVLPLVAADDDDARAGAGAGAF